MGYITGSTIRSLREKRHITQRQLAEILKVSDKTVSKWETGRGLPDIGIITELAEALGISLAELFTGEHMENSNRSSNLKKTVFYVCPVCGNIIQSVGEGSFSCCGILLPKMEMEKAEGAHDIRLELIDGEYYAAMEHEMNKSHYISFMAYVTGNRIDLVKLYPEQSAEARFTKRGHGMIYAYCNRHGLYGIVI